MSQKIFNHFFSSVENSPTLPQQGPWKFGGDLYENINLDPTVKYQMIILGFQGNHWVWEGIAYQITYDSDNYCYKMKVIGVLDFSDTSMPVYSSASGEIVLYTDDNSIIFYLG